MQILLIVSINFDLLSFFLKFFCILLIVVAAEIAAGAWAYSNKDELRNLVQVNVQTTVQEEYGDKGFDSRTRMFDTMQREVFI